MFNYTNIFDGIHVYLSLEDAPNAARPSTISLDNAGVGAVIEDGKGSIFKPSDSDNLLEMNSGSLYEYVKREVTTIIVVYPVSAAGELPAIGDYSGAVAMHIGLGQR